MNVTIQIQVPICPECSESLYLNKVSESYVCRNCGSRFKIVSQGYTDRELYCEKVYPEFIRGLERAAI